MGALYNEPGQHWHILHREEPPGQRKRHTIHRRVAWTAQAITSVGFLRSSLGRGTAGLYGRPPNRASSSLAPTDR